MGVPVEFDISQTGPGSTQWFPLNLWNDNAMRLWATLDGTVSDYNVEVTSQNVLNDASVAAGDFTSLTGWDALSAEKVDTQQVPWRAIRLTIESGVGTVRLRGQSLGNC